jgi:hypothetical protein
MRPYHSNFPRGRTLSSLPTLSFLICTFPHFRLLDSHGVCSAEGGAYSRRDVENSTQINHIIYNRYYACSAQEKNLEPSRTCRASRQSRPVTEAVHFPADLMVEETSWWRTYESVTRGLVTFIVKKLYTSSGVTTELGRRLLTASGVLSTSHVALARVIDSHNQDVA